MASLPSPPPHHTLPYSSLPVDNVEALRSSCGQLLVGIEEIQAMINWGGEAGMIGWPNLLAAYERLMSLLSLLNHHMTARSVPALQANFFGPASSSGGSKTTLTLSQHAVHPHIPSEPASEAWIQVLLSTHTPVAHEPPPEPPVGDNPAHEARRQRALRVCTALAGLHDWKGRVGLVGDVEPDASAGEAEGNDDDDDDAGMDEDEDMFGSGDEAASAPPVDKSKARGGTEGGPQAEAAVPALDKAEKERELRRLLALMARGQPLS